ncbi:MAG: gamma carbonic anhydrase family protein [Halobacteriota archaeon]
MRRTFEGSTPEVAESAFVADLTFLTGDVTIGERASIWPFVCLRGDGGPVAVGNDTNVQEFTTLHGAQLGGEVTVGHGAVVDYATVADHSLVGMQSSILRGATIESNCIVAANAVVRHGQTIPEGHLAYGTPAETRPLTDEQIDEIDRLHREYVELSRRHANNSHPVE